MDILAQFVVAAGLPELPLFGQLLAGIPFSGARLIPQAYWDALAAMIIKDAEGDGEGDVIHPSNGWEEFENHARGDSHEAWQWFTFSDLVQKAKADGKHVWVIPLNELLCLAKGDEEADDLIQIRRLVLIGSEEEMHAAVAGLLAQ